MRRAVLAVVLIVLAVGGTAACGADDEDVPARVSPAEEAFLKGMIPHHESAVEMAELAGERSEHRETRQLAEAIIESQTEEIAQMERMYDRLTGEEIAPDPAAHEQLGLSRDEAGMHEGGAAMLEGATKDFDRAFIDEMVPHHQGAIRQAYVILEQSQDEEMIDLARGIVDAQSSEIRAMNRWRKRWYGAASPAGGIPSDEELPATGQEGGGHDDGH